MTKYTAYYGQPLGPRERQVAERVNKPNKVIAHELHLTEGTVKVYLHRIFVKTGATNRTAVAIYLLTQQQHEAETIARLAEKAERHPRHPPQRGGPAR